MAKKNITVSIDRKLDDFIEEKQWDLRLKRPLLLRKILEDWAVEHGYKAPESGDE